MSRTFRHKMTFKERLDLLDDIKQCLLEDRKFYLQHKNWPKVKILTESLARHDEQKARLIFRLAKDSYKSA